MLTILDRSPGLRPGLNFSLWKKKGPGPGPNRGHSLRRNHPSKRNQQLVRRRRRLTWKRPGPLLTASSPKSQRTPRLSRWPSIAGRSGRSIGAAAGLLPGRPGPKTRLAERSSAKTLWPSSLRLVCLSQAPDADNDRARERAAEQLDQLLAEGPKRTFKVKCAGCGLPRQLKPGQTHCHPCRNLSEAPRIASLPGPAIWKADEYEKLLGETIRRYQEAHDPAPDDAKVEAAV